MRFFTFVRYALIPAALVCAVALFAACGGDGDDAGGDDTGGDRQTVEVTLVDAGCSPADITVEAGTVTFEVTNDGAGGITEFYVYDGDRVVGEVENVIEGIPGDMTLDLEPGEYTTKCPGGDENEEGTLTVTEAAGDDATPEPSSS